MRDVINQYGLTTKKKLGQHFLVDGFVLEKIITSADIDSGDLVIEIGPGVGALTQALAKKAGHVIAVEIDKNLVPLLRDLFSDEAVTIVLGDILKIDLTTHVRPYGDMKLKAVANLPYYITTPVIFNLLEGEIPFESVTVMVQKEVANRMAAKPGTKDYGALTLAIQYYTDVSLVANVPVNCFMPRPGVDSAVVKLDVLKEPRLCTDREMFFKVVKAAFGKRRKTLVNCLEGLGYSKAELEEMLTKLGLSPYCRGEVLDIFTFGEITKMLGGVK